MKKIPKKVLFVAVIVGFVLNCVLGWTLSKLDTAQYQNSTQNDEVQFSVADGCMNGPEPGKTYQYVPMKAWSFLEYQQIQNGSPIGPILKTDRIIGKFVKPIYYLYPTDLLVYAGDWIHDLRLGDILVVNGTCRIQQQ